MPKRHAFPGRSRGSGGCHGWHASCCGLGAEDAGALGSVLRAPGKAARADGIDHLGPSSSSALPACAFSSGATPSPRLEVGMLLTVREAAKLLSTPEKKIYRWVDDGEMPFHRVNDQIRFHRAELLEWATAKKLPVSVEMFHDEDQDAEALSSLSRAIETGGVHYHVAGSDGQSA